MYQKTALDNGLRVVSSTTPTHSVCICFFLGAGSRYEPAERAGVSHFVEHLCFKGTERRGTAKEISEAIEGVGGILNGGTDKELTVYWAKVARPHFSLALDVLVDMLRHSKFHPEEIEKERKVILEEINMSLDLPHQRVEMLLDEVVWPHQALGRDVAGSKETVSALTRPMLLDYLAQQYTPLNTVVSVAGDISHEEVVASLERALSDWVGDKPGPWYGAQDDQEAPRLRLEPRKVEQVHLCLALRGLSASHPDRFTLDLLNVILGEGMSSRLFVEIREKRGLAYDVHSYVTHLLDSGTLTVYAAVAPKEVEATLEAILAELLRLRDGDLPEPEVMKAKEQAKGRLLLRMEDTRSVAGWTGSQEILLGHIHTVDEVLSLVDAITPDDLARVARSLLVTEKINLAVVGPYRGGQRLKGLLKL